MSQIIVAYWSGTGNTEAMAQAVGKGITDAGKEASVVSVSEITPKKQRWSLSFRKWKALLRAKRSAFSDLTAGATANGCAHGFRE